MASLEGHDNVEIIVAYDLDTARVKRLVSQNIHPFRALIVDTSTSPKTVIGEVAMTEVSSRIHHMLFSSWETTLPANPIYARIGRTEYDPAQPRDAVFV